MRTTELIIIDNILIILNNILLDILFPTNTRITTIVSFL